MKKLIFSIIFITSGIFIFAQPFEYGIKVNLLTGNKYLNYEIGPSLILDYHFNNAPFSISVETQLLLSELSNENNFSTGFTKSNFNIGFIVNYYPISWTIEPFIAIGGFYNINNINQSGTPSISGDGYMRLPSNLKNNFSTEMNLGINFSANSTINFVVEVSQTFNKPGYNLNIINTNGAIHNTVTKIERLNFNSLFLRLGLNFKI